MERVYELKRKLSEILEESKTMENSEINRHNIYIKVRDLLDKNGLEDLSLVVEPLKYMIDKYSDYIPINYEYLEDKVYIGPLPVAALKDKLAWKFLTNKLI